jgi:hypothetical protein
MEWHRYKQHRVREVSVEIWMDVEEGPGKGGGVGFTSLGLLRASEALHSGVLLLPTLMRLPLLRNHSDIIPQFLIF